MVLIRMLAAPASSTWEERGIKTDVMLLIGTDIEIMVPNFMFLIRDAT
jgi:hypothetical protein